MDAQGEQELAVIMGRVAGGDAAAVFALVERFGAELRRAVRVEAARRGARLSAEDLEGLVLDVAMALGSCASGWTPGGAPPWVWARRRVANVVDRHVGQWADPIERHDADEPAPAPAAAVELATVELVASVAGRDPAVALLFEGVQRVASPRDVSVYFDVIIEQAGGNLAPAAAVARLHGVAPTTVRQQHRRVRTRLQRLAASDPRFAPLASLAVVA